jgi:DNA (cytosine-5)-methyltransferase 1
MRNFYEFFAGGGMARAGLGSGWQCLFANDFDHKKARVYAENWGDEELLVKDVRALKGADLPHRADMVWGSFPCQDLSLAGGGAGLKGDRSGTFWPFWEIMKDLVKGGRAPPLIVLENVSGTLTSHEGKDFTAICDALQLAGYKFGALIIDAVYFLPHSRARLFVIAARCDAHIPETLIASAPTLPFHTQPLRKAFGRLPQHLQANWIWWNTSIPAPMNAALDSLIEHTPVGIVLHTREETDALLSMMSAINVEKVALAKKAGRRMVGSVYKRTRLDEYGRKVQRAEVRFDNIAGCLRTPVGGSSRQIVIIVDGKKVESRLISSRETARLMGLPENYKLPENYNEAYHLTGDGVAVPVVRFLAEQIFEPVIDLNSTLLKAAA